MITKQTDRARINVYAQQGVAYFQSIGLLLGRLVEETATVAYEGQNAYDFKTKCTNNAVEFSKTCQGNMQSINGVVVSAVTYIATNLGGMAISLEPPTLAITAPVINADTSVESAADAPLRALAAETTRIFDAVDSRFEAHKQAFETLGATGGWVGPEYDEARLHIEDLTRDAVGGIENARSVMVSDINNQLSALGFAIA